MDLNILKHGLIENWAFLVRPEIRMKFLEQKDVKLLVRETVKISMGKWNNGGIEGQYSKAWLYLLIYILFPF